MVSLMQRRREMMLAPSGGSTPSVNDYVTDGIMLWFDGIENTRSGHDASSLTWNDLSGNGRDYPYNDKNTVYASYCDFDGKGEVVITGGAGTTFTNSIMFAEAVLDLDGTGSTLQLVIGLGNKTGTTFIKQGCVCFYGSNKAITASSGVHYYNSELYKDGVIQTSANKGDSWSTNVFGSPGRIFAYTGNTSYPLKSNLYALRLYNRVLTADEINTNWLLDKARFGI